MPPFVNWEQRFPAQSPGISGTDRIWYGIAYSNTEDLVLLFGGNNGGTTSYQDTWIWDDTTWALQSPAAKPSVRDSTPLCWDERNGYWLLFGGYNSGLSSALQANQETWSFDPGTLNWTQHTPTHKPSKRGGHGMAFCPAGNHVVLFGGAAQSAGDSAELGDTWTWDGTDWTQQSPSHTPPNRANFMGFTRSGTEVLMFGGSRQNLGSPITLGDTWLWNGSDWVEQSPANSPPDMAIPPLGECTLAGYDAILFGGMVQFTSFPITYSADTWGWDGSDWTQLAPVVTPPGSRGWTMQLAGNPHTVAPDDHDGVILYNGLLSSVEPGGTDMFQTWTFAPQAAVDTGPGVFLPVTVLHIR